MCDLCAVTTSPAVEKTLSLGTEVAGMPRCTLATVAICGNLAALSRYQTKGSDERGVVGWVLYISRCIACATFVVCVGVSAWKKSSSKSSIADLRSLHAGSCSSVAWLPGASMSFSLLLSES